jgi:hypothetical protein
MVGDLTTRSNEDKDTPPTSASAQPRLAQTTHEGMVAAVRGGGTARF